jgi:glutathione S-transferase
VADELVLTDSPRILDWLEEHYPEPPLLPTDRARRSEVRIFCDWFNQVWKRYPNGLEAELRAGAPTDENAAAMRACVGLFESLLDGREYLFDGFGLADVTAFPFLKYASFGLAPGDDDLFHRVLVEHMPLAAGSPLHAWARRVDAHPRS